jgi:hypothetical protein
MCCNILSTSGSVCELIFAQVNVVNEESWWIITEAFCHFDSSSNMTFHNGHSFPLVECQVMGSTTRM